MAGQQVGRLLVCLALTTGLWQKSNILQAATELAQWEKGAGEQSRAAGKGQAWQAGAAKAQKQAEGSRKQSCSPELKKREFSEVPGVMVEVDPNQKATEIC